MTSTQERGRSILELFVEAQLAALPRRIKLPIRLWRGQPGKTAVKRPIFMYPSQDPIDGSCAYCDLPAEELVVGFSLCASHAKCRKALKWKTQS